MELYKEEDFLITALEEGRVGLLMKQGASTDACLKAYLNAWMFRYELIQAREEATADVDVRLILRKARASTEELCVDWQQSLKEAGWAADRVLMDRAKQEYHLV